MRQISDAGRTTARRIGKAMRALQIPIVKVLTSEYCRATETGHLMGLGSVETTLEIMNMRAAGYMGGREAVILRARRVLSQSPPKGMNVVIVGHGNLMRAATDAYPDEAGSGIFAPRKGSGKGFEIVAQLSPEDWHHLVARFTTKSGHSEGKH